MIRFYLDEMYSPAFLKAARARGLDVTNSHQARRDGRLDHEQLRAATRDGRCIVTENHRHFVPLAQRFFDAQEPHAGIVLAPNSLRRGPLVGFADALVEAASLYPDGLPPYTVPWLNPPRQ